MAIVQKGTLGKTGPVFVDDSAVPGKLVFLQGTLSGGQIKLVAKQPAYARNVLGGNESDYSLGNYRDNQIVGIAPAHKMPSSGNVFNGYVALANDAVDGTTAGLEDHTVDLGDGNGSGGGSTGGGSTTPSTGGGSTTPATGGTSNGGTTTGTDTTYKAPTFMEQFQTFFSNYWWLVLLILAVVLYKPVIAPALGLSKKKRSYR